MISAVCSLSLNLLFLYGAASVQFLLDCQISLAFVSLSCINVHIEVAWVGKRHASFLPPSLSL